MSRADLIDLLVVEAHRLVPRPPLPAPKHNECGERPCTSCQGPSVAVELSRLADRGDVSHESAVLALNRFQWSHGQISALTGVPKSTVRAILKRHGRQSPYVHGGRLREPEGED